MRLPMGVYSAFGSHLSSLQPSVAASMLDDEDRQVEGSLPLRSKIQEATSGQSNKKVRNRSAGQQHQLHRFQFTSTTGDFLFGLSLNTCERRGRVHAKPSYVKVIAVKGKENERRDWQIP